MIPGQDNKENICKVIFPSIQCGNSGRNIYHWNHRFHDFLKAIPGSLFASLESCGFQRQTNQYHGFSARLCRVCRLRLWHFQKFVSKPYHHIIITRETTSSMQVVVQILTKAYKGATTNRIFSVTVLEHRAYIKAEIAFRRKTLSEDDLDICFYKHFKNSWVSLIYSPNWCLVCLFSLSMWFLLLADLDLTISNQQVMDLLPKNMV